jgi:acetolactate synthase regulatory subunit
MAAPVKHAANLETIAKAEGMTVGAVNTLLSRALRKLRKRGFHVTTARALALELDAHRETENIVRTGRRR